MIGLRFTRRLAALLLLLAPLAALTYCTAWFAATDTA